MPLTVYDAATESTCYYHTDVNKNVTELTDANGDVAAHYEYSPFGTVTNSTGSFAAANPFRFSSEYFDEETGLVYYNYRYYDPQLGRWISRDPIEEQGGYNLYGMIENNPMWGWDTLGEENWRSIPGSNIVGRGPETHAPNSKRHVHVKGYNRQVFEDGTQRPHGEGGKNKDIPKKIIDRVMRYFFKKCPHFITIPIPWFLLDPTAFKEENPSLG